MISICDNCHEPIVTESRICPLCSLMSTIDDKDSEIKMLNKKIDLMEREIEDMDDEILFLKEKLNKGD